jgi:hypothetical protein
MKNLICIAMLTFCCMAATNYLQAQDYKAAVGARLGYPLSASIKYFISEKSALEGYVGTRGYSGYRWANVSGAYLFHQPIEGVEELKWYVGGGASVYFWTYDFGIGEGFGSTSFGVQGYGGLEYTFEEVPLTISADWVPTIFFNSYASGFGYGYGSLAVRYILKR